MLQGRFDMTNSLSKEARYAFMRTSDIGVEESGGFLFVLNPKVSMHDGPKYPKLRLHQ